MESTGPDPGRGRFIRAVVAGSILAFAINLVMLAGAETSLLQDPGLLGGFYDAQARAFLDGKLAVDPLSAGFEGFLIDGGTYLYFGPLPALLRVPIAALTHDLDGQLTQLSMLAAFCVLMAATGRLQWRLRSLVRPDAPVERADTVAAFLMQLAVGTGIPLFLASQAIVYHEAELWGAALAVAAVDAIAGVVARPDARRIAWAGALAALAISTRVSVGLGPVLALGGLAAAATVPALRGLAPAGGGRRLALGLAAAALIPLALSAAVNQAKFGQPFGLPLDRQVFSSIDANRQAALQANGGSLFGAKYVPTTLVQAVRPDAAGTTRGFPYVGLPRDRATVIGDVRFDTIDHSLSAPTSMPLLFLLAIAGLVAAVRRAPLRPLLPVLAGTAAGAATSLTIAYVTTRYLADFLPFLLLAALVGLHALLDSPAVPRRALLGVAAALVLVGAVMNGSAGLVNQRLLSAVAAEDARADFVRTQERWDKRLGRRPHGVRFGRELPPPGVPGDLFVLGDCDGLYVAGRADWLPVERTERSGLRRYDARLPGPSRGSLVTLGSGSSRVEVAAPPGRPLEVLVGGRRTGAGAAVPTAGVRRMELSFQPDVVAGRFVASVRLDGEPAAEAPAPYDRLAAERLGPGVRRAGSPAPDLCRSLARRARG